MISVIVTSHYPMFEWSLKFRKPIIRNFQSSIFLNMKLFLKLKNSIYLPAILLFYYFIILINAISLVLTLFDVANFQVQSQYKINVQQSIASKSLQNFLLYITISIISHYFQQFHNTLQNTIYKSYTKISPSRNSPLHLNNPPTSPGILNSHKISSIRLSTVCT